METTGNAALRIPDLELHECTNAPGSTANPVGAAGARPPVGSAVVRRTIAGLGRTLITLGLLILLFVGYQLWGTGLYEARAQHRLEDEFDDRVEEYRSTTTRPPRTTTPGPSTSEPGPSTPTTLAPVPAFEAGDPVAIIQIPDIGVDRVVVQGTDRPDLQKGPGHYPATPFPGQLGNAAIAGHRTTYGAPFFRLDELDVGDEILIKTYWGEFHYEVYAELVVAPTDVGVVANTPGPELTLTTCNPKYSARERLVIKAKLLEERSDVAIPASDGSVDAGVDRDELVGEESLEAGLQGDVSTRSPAIGWGAVAAVVGLAWWWAFRRWRHWATWIVGLFPFLAALFAFYTYLERLLPAGY